MKTFNLITLVLTIIGGLDVGAVGVMHADVLANVFGDGTVVIKSAPGHTPGSQVLFLKLPKTGPVLLAGDLYHYPEERGTSKTPTFEFNAEQSLASRAKMEAFVKQSKAQLWIEHDIATHAKLKKAPAFIE